MLQRWQDVLGEIRDLDVAIEYLSRAKQTVGVKKVLASESALRHERYAAFVRMCRKDATTSRAAGRRAVSLLLLLFAPAPRGPDPGRALVEDA